MLPGLTLTEPQRLLCRAIADAPVAVRGVAARRLYEKLGDRAVFALARENQVEPLLAHVLMEIFGSGVSAPWRQALMKPFSASPSIWASLIAWPPGWPQTGFPWLP